MGLQRELDIEDPNSGELPDEFGRRVERLRAIDRKDRVAVAQAEDHCLSAPRTLIDTLVRMTNTGELGEDDRPALLNVVETIRMCGSSGELQIKDQPVG